jgi:hypothetical protein
LQGWSLVRFGTEQRELEPVLGHAQHAETRFRAIAARFEVDLRQLGAAQRQHIECGEHRGVAAVEVAVSEASRHIAEDGGAQGRGLALFSERLAPGFGKRPHELGIGESAISLLALWNGAARARARARSCATRRDPASAPSPRASRSISTSSERRNASI